MFRKFLMTLHTLIAAFIMPAAILFLVTGAFYTWGIKGDYEITKYSFELADSVAVQEDAVLNSLTSYLNQKQLDWPSGEPSVKVNAEKSTVSWSGSLADLSYSLNHSTKSAQLEYKKTDWYRRFVQLHKAKGGSVFKVYAVVLAFGLVVLLFSGYAMAFQLKAYRKLTLVTTLVGIVVFVLAVMLS
jgi:hypothetical protein